MKTLVKSNGAGFPDMPAIFDDFLTKDFFNLPSFTRQRNNVPSVNIKETENAYELEVAAPGMKKEDFKVELERNTLSISVEKEEKKEEKDDNYTRREFSYSSFRRSFNLPERMVDADNIAARYNDGILHLTIPKAKDAVKATRMIDVQ